MRTVYFEGDNAALCVFVWGGSGFAQLQQIDDLASGRAKSNNQTLKDLGIRSYAN
jgi:hypothetical protein